LVKTQDSTLQGAKAPAFELVDTDGQHRKLEEFTAKGPVVVIFYYGYYCNHCVAQLYAIQQDLARFQELGTDVVAISSDSPTETRKRYEKYGAFDFTVLSDPNNRVARVYGAAVPREDGEDELLHGTFIVGRDGIVHWCNLGDEPFTNNRFLLYEL